jgi:sugar lactone lactonase YvrE
VDGSGRAVDAPVAEGGGGPAPSDASGARDQAVAADAAGEPRVVLFAGGGTGGDGVRATESRVDGPFAVDFDQAGNVYIAEMPGARVRKVDAAGTITTVAGTGQTGFSGDGGPATRAQLNGPHHLLVTAVWGLLIADTYNYRIRRVASNGTITTLAGTGQRAYGGDGGSAVDARFGNTFCLALDQRRGLLYLADGDNRRVRVIDLATGRVETAAGNGTRGVPQDGGEAKTQPLVDPRAVALDSRGTLYILERSGHALRAVDPDGRIRTVAGTGQRGYSGDGAEALQATFNGPKHLIVDASDDVVIADTENHVIRKYLPRTGRIVLVAGTGRAGAGGVGGPPAAVSLNQPHGVAFDAQGALYISDSTNDRVLKIAR